MKEIVSESSYDLQVEVRNPHWFRALSLNERLASLQTQNAAQVTGKVVNHELARRRLQRWQEQDAFKKGTDFAQRLMTDHLTEDDLLVLLGESDEAIEQRTEVPNWLEQLSEVFADANTSASGTSSGISSPEEPKKFTLFNILDVFIRYGRDCLNKAIAELVNEYEHVPFDAQTVADIFVPNLMVSFAIINRTMVLELNIARLQERLHGETAEERFQNFIQQMRRKERLLPLLEEYPVLARALVTIVERWKNYSLEFLTHLCIDWQQICTTFSPAGDLGQLVQAEGGAGDVHRGGRSVFKLKFASGVRLMYKPKSLAVDIHFQELLTWLNEKGNTPCFRIVTLLDRETYGWSEYIEVQSCTTSEEIARFYERQGAYLALLYALDATDFHYENLIAAGEHPVLVDLEALFHARLSENMTGQSDVAFNFIQYSVMRVGLLPNRVFSNNASSGLDISGLGGHEGQKTPVPILSWSDAGTDQMRLQRQYQTLPGKNNRPKLSEQEVDLLEYRENIVSGFTQMYHLLIAQRNELIMGPLERFAHDEVRCIMRATNFYAHLLGESFHPDLLSDALNRDRHFDHLWLAINYNRHLAKLVTAERIDLLSGDVPMFTSRPDTRSIYSSRGECIPDFFEQSSLDVAKQTLLALDEHDLERQCWFINASFTSMLMGKGQPLWKRPSVHVPTGKEVTRERLLMAARAVGDRLCEVAIGDEKGVNWVGLSLVQERQWMLASANPDLYSGNAGIMLFLSYLGAITGDARYIDTVEYAYITMSKQVEQMKNQLKAIGAFDGWGSVIYLLTHLGTLWNDPTLLAEAQEIVEMLPDMIEQDTAFDVLSGAAGCLLSLLSLYQIAPAPSILATALKCGEHLLATVQVTRDGAGWVNAAMSNEPLTGFSHGAAGCAFSLFALADVSGEERFHQLGLQVLAYERSVFSPHEQNWPDLRIFDDSDAGLMTARDGYMVAWCHGAAGIGLSRLAMLRYLDDEEIREEIAVALRKTVSAGFGLNHSICHGDLGNVETLLVATKRLAEPVYQEQLNYFTGLILDSIDKDGWLAGIPLGVEAPGLMTGLAGIGYELLRLAEPERVPSVLLVEPPIKQHA